MMFWEIFHTSLINPSQLEQQAFVCRLIAISFLNSTIPDLKDRNHHL
jgi:hypothetical protein